MDSQEILVIRVRIVKKKLFMLSSIIVPLSQIKFIQTEETKWCVVRVRMAVQIVILAMVQYRGEIFLISKVQCMLCFENCTTEGRGGERGGSENFKNLTEP